jgi:uncharacterized membrane protein
MKPIDYFFVIAWNLVAISGFILLIIAIKAPDKLGQARKSFLRMGVVLFLIGFLNFIAEVVSIATRHR